MLAPIKEPKKRERNFAVYDLEWLPAHMSPTGDPKLRLVGVFDKVQGYRSYETIEAFLRSELTKQNRGVWFYAHAGGLADVQFLLETLVQNDAYSVEGSFSGSSAVRVKVKRDELAWHFVDSYWTLRASLKKIGDLLGMPKGECAWDAPLPELTTYNEQDCRILYEALEQFEQIILELGSEMNMTLASTALRLIRRKYLQREIPTSGLVNEMTRPAYVGGRVEVFYQKRHHGFYYDINSCYPKAMTEPLPGAFRRATKKLPSSGGWCYIADVLIDVPDMDVPVLPYVADGSLFFPVGRRRSWICGPELELAEAQGCKIQKVYDCLLFEPFTDLANFASDLYGRRKLSAGYMTTIYKLLLNSGYGKFGERNEKSELICNPTEKEYEKLKQLIEGTGQGEEKKSVRFGKDEATSAKHFEKGHLHQIVPGVFLLEKLVETLHAHVPIAAYVTSLARVNLYQHFLNADSAPYYCDTDGFAVSDPNLPTSNELGDLKLEKEYKNALFYAPKLYHLETASGEDIVKAKGFRSYRADCDECKGARCKACDWTGQKDYDIDVFAFEKLLAGEALITNRMLRIRELFSKGLLAPKEEVAEKRLKNVARTKRRFHEDGTSSPWHVDEFEQTPTLPRYGERGGKTVRVG